MAIQTQRDMGAASTVAGINTLLDHIQQVRQLKNDAALARFLGVQAPVVSRLRRGTRLSSAMILRIHERTDISVKEIRALATERQWPNPPTP